MRIKQLLVCWAIVVVALVSCSREPQPPIVSFEFSDVTVDAGQTSATISCYNTSVDDDRIHANVLLSRNENITGATKYPMQLKDDTLRCTIYGLERNTMYFYCFEVSTLNEFKRAEGVYHFETEDGSALTVTTSEAINVTTTTATGGGSVLVEGNYTVSVRGVCWDTLPNPNVLQSPHQASGEGMGSFMVNITGLTSGTIYYMRAYAMSNELVYYGNEVTFTTQHAQLPTVTTEEVSNITLTSALGGGDVIDDGGAEVTRRGLCWSTSHNPTAEGSHAENGTGTGAYPVAMTNLTPNTTYYVRAYAENYKGLAYGDEVEFKTAHDVSSPSVEIINIVGTTVHCEVTTDGGAEVTERGICWSTSHNPTTEDDHATNGTGTGSFSVELTDLQPGTTYYIRAYAVNSVGTAYSGELTHSTTASLPTVVIGEVTNITQTTAQGSGEVIDDGGAEVTERGLCWSTSHNPTTSGSHASAGTGVGAFTVNMTGLTSNTGYYVRAYAINSAGTIYSNEISFRTSQNISAPTVVTVEVTDITQTTAKVKGNVTGDGGANVTERGVCWSSNHNPTVNGTHLTSGTGTGPFTVTITGLTANTTYYVRAYAKNSQGISYGAEVSFITSPTTPTVTTAQVTNITQTTAVCGGNVTESGGAPVTARGVCWSTSHNPTVSNSHTSNGTGTGAFTSNITGLTASTTYYVRAYATNSAGTSYGGEVSFITAQNVTPPTVTTNEVTNITQTTATCGGNVTSNGGGSVTARGVCWSTSQNPTVNDNHTTDGSGTGDFTSNIIGLTPGTTYYVRAYATNSAGTAYGAQRMFQTPQNVTLPTVTTNEVTNIAQTTATCGGDVTDSGGATVTARGVCWSTSQNPTVSNDHTADGAGTGGFTSNITGLTPGTTYYVRAYATNSAGTAYGEPRTFQTLQNVTLPTVTTNEVTDITQTTATCGGNVTNNGGANVSARGVCWSINPNPTINDSHSSNGTGPGGFTSNLTGLTPGTTYYVRAYATNSAGTAYGEQRTFETLQNVTLPTVTTNTVTNISQTMATSGGNVTDDGGATVTERGICWGTSQNPTINGTHQAAATSGTGLYSVNMTGLTPNTTYHVRAYATNEGGTAYGNDLSFNTLQIQSYTITLSANPSNAGTVSGGGTYTQNQSCTVHAIAHAGYIFDNWTENGTVVSTSMNYTFPVTGNRTLVANFIVQPAAPTGAINGVFSVSNTQRVWFSQGNLQYMGSASTPYWKFADNQWDSFGTTTGQGSDSPTVDRDLFGWGTSGYDHGAGSYQPWSTSPSNNNYYAYGQSTYNLYDGSGQADWGYNPISNGGNQPNQWRTLNAAEWGYVFNTRTTASGIRYAKAKVSGVNGVILVPDNWNADTYPLSSTNSNSANYNNNTITASQWTVLEQAGAVFLPAAGYRYGTSILSDGSDGHYWSSTVYSNSDVYYLTFSSTYLMAQDKSSRHFGRSVRLVTTFVN